PPVKTRLAWFAFAFLIFTTSALIGRGEEAKKPAFPRFRMQEIEKGLKVGYAVLLVDVNGDGKKDIVVVDTNRVVWYENPSWQRQGAIGHCPLMGRNSSAKNNWMDGEPVRILAYKIPKDPTKDRWMPDVVNESLHVVHNFWPVPSGSSKGMDILTASYEGVSLLVHGDNQSARVQLGKGNQANPKDKRGHRELQEGR